MVAPSEMSKLVFPDLYQILVGYTKGNIDSGSDDTEKKRGADSVTAENSVIYLNRVGKPAFHGNHGIQSVCGDEGCPAQPDIPAYSHNTQEAAFNRGIFHMVEVFHFFNDVVLSGIFSGLFCVVIFLLFR